MADFKYIDNNYIYVDALHGNDANAGTEAAPKQTLNGALSIANNEDVVVLGTGWYSHIETAPLPIQGISIIGDGFVVLDGTGEVSGNGVLEVNRVKNVNFYNYGSGAFAVSFRSKTISNTQLVGCGFFGCDFENSNNSFEYIKDCVFQDCVFDGNQTGTEEQGIIKNCTFISCQGQLGDNELTSYGIYNNIYINCNNMDHGILQPGKYDFNNIYQTFNNQSLANQKEDGVNLNGSDYDDTVIFNDYDALRPLADWWKQSYTQQATSPLLTSGRNGSHVGRYYSSYFLSAQDLWNTYLDNSQNTQLSTDVIDVIIEGNVAFYESDTIPTGDEKLGRINVNANSVYGANGELLEWIHSLKATIGNVKSSISVELCLTDQAPAEFLAMDNYWYLGYGADTGQAPPYQGTADDDFNNIGNEFVGILEVQNNTVKIRADFDTTL